MRKINFLLFYFVSFLIISQNYEGEIITEKEGLHKILLTPNVRSASSENFDHLRIKNSKNEEVPYVLMHNTDNTFAVFKRMKITSKKRVKNKYTSVTIENIKLKKQEHLTLRIRNTKVNKRYDVLGSDNGKDWFGLISGKYLYNINTPHQTFAEKTINFSLNTYKFLRVVFKDKNSLPINVLEVGTYENKFLTQSPIEIENYIQEITTYKDKKITQIKFKANSAQKINTISFTIDTEFYLRKAKIIVQRTREIKKRTEVFNDVISSFYLNSKNKNTFDFSNLNEKEFIIEIENEDNPALNIKEIKLHQRPIYIITNLKNKQAYTFLIDNKLSKPSYDLGNFISNKTTNVATAKITNFKEFITKETITQKLSFWQTKEFMWGCILIAILFILYIAFGLIKDIGAEK